MDEMKDIRGYHKTIIETAEMQRYLNIVDYKEFAGVVIELLNKGIIEPVKSSKHNAKRPRLYNKYRILKEKKDYSELFEEMRYKLNYELNLDYYLNKPEKYLEVRDNIIKLSDFLNAKKELLNIPISFKERSFQIWGREKYLEREGGKTLLKHLKFPIEKLNIYYTTEPLAYYSQHKESPQKILIIENKDTYYTFRKYLIDGKPKIFDMNIGTVIYGSGKSIWNSFNDFAIGAEKHLLDEKNEFFYFGDLDYEGIFIFQQLYDNFAGNYEIKPFVEAYKYMIDKYENVNVVLPETKEGQNRKHFNYFLEYFDDIYRKKIVDILESNRYIPQEIINYKDLLMGEHYAV